MRRVFETEWEFEILARLFFRLQLFFPTHHWLRKPRNAKIIIDGTGTSCARNTLFSLLLLPAEISQDFKLIIAVTF